MKASATVRNAAIDCTLMNPCPPYHFSPGEFPAGHLPPLLFPTPCIHFCDLQGASQLVGDVRPAGGALDAGAWIPHPAQDDLQTHPEDAQARALHYR